MKGTWKVTLYDLEEGGAQRRMLRIRCGINGMATLKGTCGNLEGRLGRDLRQPWRYTLEGTLKDLVAHLQGSGAHLQGDLTPPKCIRAPSSTLRPQRGRVRPPGAGVLGDPVDNFVHAPPRLRAGDPRGAAERKNPPQHARRAGNHSPGSRSITGPPSPVSRALPLGGLGAPGGAS